MRQSIFVNISAAKAARKSADVAERDLLASNRPLITITPIELCDANEARKAPHVHFGWRNSGKGVGIINKVGVAIRTAVPGALTLQTQTGFVTSEVNGAIEVGETKDGNRVDSALLTAAEVQRIRNGEVTLLVTFQVISQDIFYNPYDQKFPFVFDHRLGEFVRNNLFTGEKKIN